MKDEVAERLLARLMGWEVEELKARAPQLQTLATLKYDEYGQYRPGAKFAENLCIWLRQFQSGTEREIALRFVEEELLFISDRELGHIIELAYPDLVEQIIGEEVAVRLGIPSWRVAQVRESVEFAVARRRSLFLGLSDGARLDRFRRSAPHLSHEQIAQEYEISDHLISRMVDDLSAALEKLGAETSPTFERIWLIDDFAGSGQTLLRLDPDDSTKFKGKLVKFSDRLQGLVTNELIEPAPAVFVLLYVATDQALTHVRDMLGAAGLGTWQLHVVYEIPQDSQVDHSSDIAALCHGYYDSSTEDSHKGSTPLGYGDCALPLVLAHNTPNNSICLLWAETGLEPPGQNRRALFPRYERHHRDRP